MNNSSLQHPAGTSEVANHECSICKKEFLDLSALKNHQHFTHCHTEETNYHNSTNEVHTI